MTKPSQVTGARVEEPVSAFAWKAYTGAWHPHYATPAFLDWIKTWLTEAEQRTQKGGRQHEFIIAHPDGEPATPLWVKAFARQPGWKDWIDAAQGSKAQRACEAGWHLQAHGIGTPFTVGYVNQWHGRRLRYSYLFTQQETDISSFKRELIRLYRLDPDCTKLMQLLQVVATEVRRMHDSGLMHGDLGNQNILLRRQGSDTWGDVQFIDLNRCRIQSSLSLRQRAFDLSRLTLPSDFLRVFKAMYAGQTRFPPAWHRWEKHYRKRFAFHTATRAWRHPFRPRPSATTDPASTYPHPKEIWIWDEKSAQAIVTLESKDRHRHYPKFNAWRIAASVVRDGPAVARRYRQLRDRPYTDPVEMTGRIGVSLHTHPDTWEREQGLLDGLGTGPVLVRFYHHQDEGAWNFTADCVDQLCRAGRPVAVAVVQDRHAVTDPSRWHQFVHGVLDRVGAQAEWIEAGHAINRVKWGIWDLDEYVRLLQPFRERKHTLKARLMGPAVIDFEYHYLLAALRRCDASPDLFDALSHHLYVDRRGAPENRQSGFSTLEKCRLAKAIADTSPVCASRLILSEVNWPLAGTGEYSPVGSPYVTPGLRLNDPGVDEATYAAYMLRYLVITLASGLVEQVYWWRLAAHGYGLVDDRPADDWRPRPAYRQLQFFLHVLGQARFIHYLTVAEPIHGYVFERPDGERVLLVYAHPHPAPYEVDAPYATVQDAEGNERPAGASIELGASPLYIRGFEGTHVSGNAETD